MSEQLEINYIIDQDWREHKKYILVTLDKNTDKIASQSKELIELKLHLQKIENNTETIKALITSEKKENIEHRKNKNNGFSLFTQILISIISSVTAILSILLTGLLDKL